MDLPDFAEGSHMRVWSRDWDQAETAE
jgi:hypothetical protein